jgi:phosphatidylserine/phosphatidylglycerophosphate/cardiolipin synthase-like enzyme
MHDPVAGLNFATDSHTAGVRCLGVVNGSRSNRPRLHHKFMVALRGPLIELDGSAMYESYAVWTGSFNPTRGGTRSLENAVAIYNPAVAASFYAEWGQALALSEPLNWQQPYVSPSYRVGS